MSIAILSDIHGNLGALQAVVEDIASHGADSICCLGDLIGYGVEPLKCIELAMEWEFTLQGDIDRIDDNQFLPGFRSDKHAERTTVSTKAKLKSHPRRQEIVSFMAERPVAKRLEGSQFAHGVLGVSTKQKFLFPESVFNRPLMTQVFEEIDTISFCAGSHIPGIFEANSSDSWRFIAPCEACFRYQIEVGTKVVCNVGAVGQPRDRDSRACYVLWDDGQLLYRRVEYDVDRAEHEIRQAYDQ